MSFIEQVTPQSTREVTWEEATKGANEIARQLVASGASKELQGIIGIPRGGMPLATMLAYALSINNVYTLDEFVEYVDQGTMTSGHYLLVDDISDSGDTLHEKIKLLDPPGLEITVATLFKRQGTRYEPDTFAFDAGKDWLNFPWELPYHFNLGFAA